MRLVFFLYPEHDLQAGVRRWQRRGLQPLWWPDEQTVILGGHPGSMAQVMLEDDPTEHRLGAGPVFVVDDVGGFRAAHPDLDWLLEPCEVPAGRYAAFTDDDGPVTRILDLTNDLGERGALFAAPAASAPEFDTVVSPHPVARTIDLLCEQAVANGLRVFARIDHSANARELGIDLRPTTLVLFGHPRGGTPLMLDRQHAGLDLPVRALAWQDEHGVVRLSAENADRIADRHALGPASADAVAAIAAGLRRLVDATLAHP